jgi:hypothetical protein
MRFVILHATGGDAGLGGRFGCQPGYGARLLVQRRHCGVLPWNLLWHSGAALNSSACTSALLLRHPHGAKKPALGSTRSPSKMSGSAITSGLARLRAWKSTSTRPASVRQAICCNGRSGTERTRVNGGLKMAGESRISWLRGTATPRTYSGCRSVCLCPIRR